MGLIGFVPLGKADRPLPRTIRGSGCDGYSRDASGREDWATEGAAAGLSQWGDKSKLKWLIYFKITPASPTAAPAES
jgi:hypothetical protein